MALTVEIQPSSNEFNIRVSVVARDLPLLFMGVI